MTNKFSIFAISLFSVILLAGATSVSNFDNNSQNNSIESIPEFATAFVQFASATGHLVCSENSIDDGAGNCICDDSWSGLQCEVSGG